MKRSIHGAASTTATRILLLAATLLACGCGGGNGVGSVGDDAGEEASADATSDGGGGGPEGSADMDHSVPRDSAGDAPQDQSVADSPSDRTPPVDAPADQTSVDAPADQTSVDAPADQGGGGMDAPADVPTVDAPADVVTVCNAATCPTGCCSGNTCVTPSASACGVAGAACVDCTTTGDGCSITGACTCGGNSACGSGQICSGGGCTCNATSCPSGCCQGNTCQPGNTTGACGGSGGTCATCASGDSCTGGMCVAPSPTCGNGVLDTGEQCDDGNLVNLDGCDSGCKFEQDTRATQITLVWAHDTFCTKDVLLEAVQNAGFANVHGTLQGDLNSYVAAGTDNLILKYFAITDLTGQSGTASVASYNALAATYTGTATGTADLDWWYTLDTTTAGASPLYSPTAIESAGTFTNGTLNASGGHVWVSAFGTSLLDLASVKLQLPVATPATKPTASSGASPGHLASEHLDPNVTSFATGGGTNAAPTGLLCGNTTALSLSQTAVPTMLQQNCKEGYGASNNMLDVFVGGCTANLVGTIINAVQPDQINPDAPAAGAGGPYTFQESATHAVNGCKDHTGATVTPYTACLGPAAYSTYLKVAVDRVILKHP